MHITLGYYIRIQTRFNNKLHYTYIRVTNFNSSFLKYKVNDTLLSIYVQNRLKIEMEQSFISFDYIYTL